MIPNAMIKVNKFAKKRLAMRPQAKSGLVEKSSGPGLRPHIISPPSKTAPVPEPGIPRASSGANDPAAAALFAASQLAIPSIAPLPRGSSLLKAF
ncbi:hypothetical protein SDC9_63116 [bioreactor metagenome]|uniref:Uncharacterized protein n=1 Tax=bioreactor metagenome TaxID=1076179 RepID=A0A644XKN1_9ZZZZ